MKMFVTFAAVLFAQLPWIQATAEDEWMDKFYRLRDWLKEHGGKGLDNVRPELFDYGGFKVRGLAAAKDLSVEGEDRLLIPEQLRLSSDHPSVKDLVSRGLNRIHNRSIEPKLYAIIAFLAMERRKILNNKTSFWAPYIESLPSDKEFAQFHPAWADGKELEIFGRFFERWHNDNDYGFDGPGRVKNLWQKEAGFLRKGAKKLGVTGLTFEDFRWALHIGNTRGFYNGNADVYEMIPILDLANHADMQVQNAYVDFEAKEGSFRLDRPIAKGHEIKWCYGKEKDNGQLFVLYGFVDSRNSRKFEQQIDKKRCDDFLADRLMSSKALASSSAPTLLANLQALVREACSPYTIKETARTVSSE